MYSIQQIKGQMCFQDKKKVEKYWQKCYSHSPDKEEITLFQTQWEEKSWNVIQDGLMCPKALLFFFPFQLYWLVF